ncbi:titin-like [Atheta coriaria]|uniref:titin-like n=1 Tax=Dalotia coriaria TaxID=877792 RepID=UPI0031F422A0
MRGEKIVERCVCTQVLWLRQWPSATPSTLLSVGVSKHTADDRYYVEHIRHLQNWGLVIKHVHVEDEGVYKCQVSTHPPTIILIHLKVTKAYAEILGAPDLHLRAGSTLHLACQIRQSTEPPEYVFWYHEDRMINYDAGVQALTNSASNVLIVPDADKSHDGNYTCKPSNAVPAHINVHVLNATEEENPAAMLHANGASIITMDLFNHIIITMMSIFIGRVSNS